MRFSSHFVPELDDELAQLKLSALDAQAPPTTLRVVTWNVWFAERSRFRRGAELLKTALRCDPHVEVTPTFLQLIFSSQCLRERFAMSGPLEHSYDVLILVRVDLKVCFWSIDIPTKFGRRCLVADIVTAGGVAVRVATVHLESLKENWNFRERQLQRILSGIFGPASFTSECTPSSVILCCDFNFCSTWPENSLVADSGFVDLWPRLQGSDPGFTEDTSCNEMLAKTCREPQQVRFDRVLLGAMHDQLEKHASFATALSIQLLGTTSISARLWPSDHFGLSAEIGLSDSAHGPAAEGRYLFADA